MFVFLAPRYQDEHTKAFSLVKSSESFLGLYLDLLCVSFLACVAVGALVVTQDSGKSPVASSDPTTDVILFAACMGS